MYPLLAIIIGAALSGPQLCEMAPDGTMLCRNGGRMEVVVDPMQKTPMSCICLGEIDPLLSLEDQKEVARVHDGMEKEIRERGRLEFFAVREKAKQIDTQVQKKARQERDDLREKLFREMKKVAEFEENEQNLRSRLWQEHFEKRQKCADTLEYERAQARFFVFFSACSLLQIFYYVCRIVLRVVTNAKFRKFCEYLLLAGCIIVTANGPSLQSFFVK